VRKKAIRNEVGRLSKLRAREVANGAKEFFESEGRTFPWREERDPFKLAVAEILLQKTRASTVVPIYLKITRQHPTPLALSEAKTACIEVQIRSLGLSNKRARQLVSMAGAALKFGPAAFDEWRVLLKDVPGIGAYAARAIACFGRGQAVGIVDANVARILRRIFRVATKDRRAAIYQRLADTVAQASTDARATNFGLLDIGATVCLPRPLCGQCPFESFCPRYGLNLG
jgi:A/G-specific adenine glycosylase